MSDEAVKVEGSVEVTAEAVKVEGSVEVTAEAVKVEATPVVKISPMDAAAKIAETTGLTIRDSKSESYRCLVCGEKPDETWKKGLIFQVYRTAKGLNLEFQMYSSKGGAHLVEFNPVFEAFGGVEVAGQKIVVLPKGLAKMLRVQIADSEGLEGVGVVAKAFVDTLKTAIDKTLAKIVLEAPKAKKTPKAVAEKTEGKAGAKKAKSKSKKVAPPPAAPVAPVTDAGVDAAVAEITAG